jgi:hypothetical protein
MLIFFIWLPVGVNSRWKSFFSRALGYFAREAFRGTTHCAARCHDTFFIQLSDANVFVFVSLSWLAGSAFFSHCNNIYSVRPWGLWNYFERNCITRKLISTCSLFMVESGLISLKPLKSSNQRKIDNNRDYQQGNNVVSCLHPFLFGFEFEAHAQTTAAHSNNTA